MLLILYWVNVFILIYAFSSLFSCVYKVVSYRPFLPHNIIRPHSGTQSECDITILIVIDMRLKSALCYSYSIMLRCHDTEILHANIVVLLIEYRFVFVKFTVTSRSHFDISCSNIMVFIAIGVFYVTLKLHHGIAQIPWYRDAAKCEYYGSR